MNTYKNTFISLLIYVLAMISLVIMYACGIELALNCLGILFGIMISKLVKLIITCDVNK